MGWRFSAVVASLMFAAGMMELISGHFSSAASSFCAVCGWSLLSIEEMGKSEKRSNGRNSGAAEGGPLE